ncbi:MAG: CotH kinase family protein [Clostridia bacterium]|nr:CotH kinase family protein [Clostridia bacterium]
MKKLCLAVAVIALMLLMALATYATDISVVAPDGREFTPKNNAFYLPSYLSPQGVKIAYENGSSVAYTDKDENTAVLSSGDVLDITYGKDVYNDGKTVYRIHMTVDGSFKVYSFYFADNLPSVHIETELGINSIVSSNGKDVSTKATIINKDGTYEYADTDTTCSEFKVRGNTTKDYAKKPFQLKLSAKTDLFGMGEGKSWILLANYLDQSLIRNSVMYKIGSILGMATSSFQSVDLFVDGEYYGIYLLCEKVQINPSRVNIVDLEKNTDALNTTYSSTPVVVDGIANTIITQYSYIPGVVNPDDITGGYLIELDNNYWDKELCYFITSNKSHYVVKSPEYASKEQVEYIATLFGEMEEAIMSPTGYNRHGKHYSEYADIDSFVYAYIVAEFSRNYDAGSSSMYFYKDADVNGVTSKIVKGPLWDCDNTIGNIHKNGASSTSGYWARERSIWGGLTKHSDFNALVTRELARVYDEIFDMIDKGGYIYELVEEIGHSVHMERMRWHSDDYSKWPTYFDGTHYDRWQSSPVFNFIEGAYSSDLDRDSTTVIGYLCEHIEARLNWLAEEWGCNVTLRERSFEDKKPEPNPDDTPSSTPDSIPDSTIDSTNDSTTDSTPNSTIDSTLDSTPNSTPNSTIDSAPNSTVDSTTDSGLDSSVDSVPTTDSTTDESVPNSSFDSENENQQNGNDDSDGDNTVMLVVVISLAVVAIAGIGTAIFLGIKLKTK